MKELIVARNPARKRRTPAQKRATAKMIAANRRRSRGGSTTRRTTKRRTTAKRRPARSRAVARRRAPARRRNPAMFGGRGAMGRIINNQVMPALVGGTGAVANDVLYNFIPFPPALSVGPMRHVGKAASAIGLSWLASFFLSKRQAEQLGAGALTVVGYNVVRELVQRFAPQINMGEYLSPNLGYYGAGMSPGMGEYLQPGVGQIPGTGVYVPNQLTQGTPYMAGLGTTWPTQYEEESGSYDYEM